jgi:hypothetical protein
MDTFYNIVHLDLSKFGLAKDEHISVLGGTPTSPDIQKQEH